MGNYFSPVNKRMLARKTYSERKITFLSARWLVPSSMLTKPEIPVWISHPNNWMKSEKCSKFPKVLSERNQDYSYTRFLRVLPIWGCSWAVVTIATADQWVLRKRSRRNNIRDDSEKPPRSSFGLSRHDDSVLTNHATPWDSAGSRKGKRAIDNLLWVIWSDSVQIIFMDNFFFFFKIFIIW